MDIERIISSAIKLIKDKPKTIIPQALIWIPLTYLMIIFYQYAKDLSAAGLNETFTTDEAALQAINQMWALAQPYLIWFTSGIIFLILTSSFIKATYPTIAKQYINGKPLNLKEAFELSKTRFLNLFATHLLFMLTIFAIATLSYLPIIITPYFAIISFLITIALIIIAMPISLVISPVVVLENKSFLDAIKRAYNITKKNKFNAWILVIVLMILLMVFNMLISLITTVLSGIIGNYTFGIDMIVMLFTGTFASLTANFFYFDILKTKKK